jgi:hypothetical protein
MKRVKIYYRPNQKSDFDRKGKLMWVLKKKKQQDRINLELMDEVREYKLCG